MQSISGVLRLVARFRESRSDTHKVKESASETPPTERLYGVGSKIGLQKGNGVNLSVIAIESLLCRGTRGVHGQEARAYSGRYPVLIASPAKPLLYFNILISKFRTADGMNNHAGLSIHLQVHALSPKHSFNGYPVFWNQPNHQMSAAGIGRG